MEVEEGSELWVLQLVASFEHQHRCRADTPLIGEGPGKQQESITSLYQWIFFIVKQACIPSVHCLYRALGSAGVTEEASSCELAVVSPPATFAQVGAVCEGGKRRDSAVRLYPL
jgi:hypothetical protein